MGSKTKVSVQFQSSGKSRNWASASEDLSSVFIVPNAPAPAPITPSAAAGSSPQASSDSGERSAFLLDWMAAPSLSLWHNSSDRCSSFLCAWGTCFHFQTLITHQSLSTVFFLAGLYAIWINPTDNLPDKNPPALFDSALFCPNMFQRPRRHPVFFFKYVNRNCCSPNVNADLVPTCLSICSLWNDLWCMMTLTLFNRLLRVAC